MGTCGMRGSESERALAGRIVGEGRGEWARSAGSSAVGSIEAVGDE